jgi:hypothetical protein
MAKFEESTDDTERLTFYPDGTAMVIKYSTHSRKFNKVTLKLTKDQYNKWNEGMLIQHAMPHLDLEEREFLLTGYTPTDWAAMFPPEKGEEE